MVTNRVLLFGGHSIVGRALQKLPLPGDWALRAVNRADCDFTQTGQINQLVQSFEPDLVINAAEMSDLGACEADRPRAREVNFHAVANIAAQCDTVSAPFLHLSTAMVFDGSENTAPYKPDTPMNPLNAYGETKMMGEESARHGLYWHVILRAATIFDAEGDNVLTRLLAQIDTQDEIAASADLRTSFTSATAVAEALCAIGTAILGGKGNGFGTYHVASEPEATPFAFLTAAMEAYAPFTTQRPTLRAVTETDPTDPVRLPAYTVMDGAKLQATYNIAPRSWREDLAHAIRRAAAPMKDTPA